MSTPLDPLDVALQLANMGRLDDAETVLRYQPRDDPRVVYNLGWHDLRHGKFRQGFEGLDAGRWIDVFGNPPIPGRMLHGKDPLDGKIIMFRGEGGYGDQICNFRFAKELRDKYLAEVIISARSGLWSLFRQEGFYCVAEAAADQGWCQYDYWVPAMSAAYILGHDYETLDGGQYLHVDCVPKLKDLKDRSPRIGIRWGGLTDHELEPMRRVQANSLIESVRIIPSAKVYSFQRDADLQALPEDVVDLSDKLPDWLETARQLSNMDLLITSCTSMAHLGGALGVPTWVLTPILPYYTWALPGDRTPWYDSVRLIRQTRPGSWAEPLDEVSRRLKEAYDERGCCLD